MTTFRRKRKLETGGNRKNAIITGKAMFVISFRGNKGGGEWGYVSKVMKVGRDWGCYYRHTNLAILLLQLLLSAFPV